MTNNPSVSEIERIVYKCADDLAVSISRSFERFEERLESLETRLYSRLSDLEDLLSKPGV